MPTYKCPTVGDCERANNGEIFVRSPGEDLKCPECATLLVPQIATKKTESNPKLIIAAIAVAVVVIGVAGGGLYYKKTHSGSVETTAAVAPEPTSTPTVAPAAANVPSQATSGGISPSDADISAQRKESDAKLKQGDASGAESASNQVAAKEMVKVAIAQMSQGKLDDAEKELNNAAARDPKQSLVYYNLAVLRLKQGRTNDAFKELEASFLNGFTYFDEMQKDPDLDAIRNDPRFTALIKKYRTTT
ncbi:tetratricopeptide repeat protein [Paraburkholderia diazotrophica]|uniref:tetratricopeptide repeat protein n=1 Tax=Paraburkholderia diazotrophica TaxID=667676 RepID=UPI00316E8A45